MSKKIQVSLQVTGIALAVSQAFAPAAMAQAAAADTNVVVVKGMRASARSSVAIKRDAMEIVDSITADDIGKLPDPNVAETLTRIPGVQGYRYGGEGASPFGAGSGLTIRGLTGQTASRVNGRAIFTAGGREFNIEGAVPGMIAGVDVYKNPSAEHIEGGIGGVVNMRTRNPSDFKGLTGALNVTSRYNDLSKKTDPELFGLLANKWDLGGGSRIGVMAAASFQKSTGRADSNPTGGGLNYKRAIRADSAEYATLANANTADRWDAPQRKYIGDQTVNFMAGVPMRPNSATESWNMPNTDGMTAEQAANVMSAPGMASSLFQETILRTRKGLNLAADYRVSNTLRFYSEYNYTYYEYHQQYRFLQPDGFLGNVRNLQTTPFDVTEGMANRNFNGGNDNILTTKRMLSGTTLGVPVNTIGGEEHSPYTTWVAAAGAEWSPTPDLSLKADLSYVKSDRTKDNRSVTVSSAIGKTWDITRDTSSNPHTMSLAGPSLTDANNFVFRNYDNGGKDLSDDNGHAFALSGSYLLGDGVFKKLKFGTRYSRYESLFKYLGFNRNLTTNNNGLDFWTQSNGINAGPMANSFVLPPNNILDGQAGMAGGFLVYSPDLLSGNTVANAFPGRNIPLEGADTENLLDRRVIGESTLAGYMTSDFAMLNNRLRGNVGVRVVRTEATATGNSADRTPGTTTPIFETTTKVSYTNVLPSLNMTYDLTPDFLVRLGYGRGMTRASTDKLNPRLNLDLNNGSGNVGNPDLRPQIADSYDISFERYFNKTNYVSTALFTKQIDGFFNNIGECYVIPNAPAYSGTAVNGCPTGQYYITRDINAEKGYARGVEVAGQYFFDSSFGMLNNFGVSASYTFVKTNNPLNFGTAAAPRIYDTPQPYQSKNNFSVSGMYETNKMSARLVYTWRSASSWGNESFVPVDGRYIDAYGILDGSFNYEINDNISLSINAMNILDKAPHRFVGTPLTYRTGIERQHYANGRTFAMGLRFKFGAK